MTIFPSLATLKFTYSTEVKYRAQILQRKKLKKKVGMKPMRSKTWILWAPMQKYYRLWKRVILQAAGETKEIARPSLRPLVDDDHTLNGMVCGIKLCYRIKSTIKLNYDEWQSKLRRSIIKICSTIIRLSILYLLLLALRMFNSFRSNAIVSNFT